MRRSCNRHLQNAMFLHASTSRARSQWATAFYKHLRERGRSHAAANRAVANKWIKILFTLLQRGELYSEQTHLDHLRNNGVAWCPAAGAP